MSKWSSTLKVLNNNIFAEICYDGLNRRTKQWTPSDERHYYYNAAWQVVQVDMWSGEGPTVSVHKQYVWDLRYIDAPIFMDLDTNQQAGFEDRYYYTTDANMNVTALVAESGGNVVERYRYDPYGAVTIMDNSFSGRTSSSYDNVILFAGYHYDPATGLNLARNRYYTSLLGLWNTTDPGGYIDGPNLYQYVHSNPPVGVDPMGLLNSRLENEWHQGADVNIRMRRAGPGNDRWIRAGTLRWIGSSHAGQGMHGIDVWDPYRNTSYRVSYAMASFALERGLVESILPNATQDRRLAGLLWVEFARRHDANQPCGPDVTSALADVLTRITNFYDDQPSDSCRNRLCATATLPSITFAHRGAWDINYLYMRSTEGFRERSRSVQVSGRCYDAASVNYVMYGLIGRLCGQSLSRVESTVEMWKTARYGAVDRETMAWTRAGYNGWDPSDEVYSFTPYRVGNRRPISGMTFTWLPYMREGESSDIRARIDQPLR